MNILILSILSISVIVLFILYTHFDKKLEEEKDELLKRILTNADTLTYTQAQIMATLKELAKLNKKDLKIEIKSEETGDLERFLCKLPRTILRTKLYLEDKKNKS